MNESLTNARKVKIGEVTHAYFDPQMKAVQFTITFEKWGVKLQGTCKSGLDPITGHYISAEELKQKTKQFINMPVYDEDGEYSAAERPSYEKLKKIRFHVSLKSMRIGVSESGYRPDMNTFLRKLFA